MIRIGINGFGRIGRVFLRVLLSKYLSHLKPVVINTSGSMEAGGWAHLFSHDSVYGRFRGKVDVRTKDGEEIGVMTINHQRVSLLAQKDPSKIPWKKYKADVVIESTGIFRDKKSASAHLTGGAKKVVISAPANGTRTYVMGINNRFYRGELVINNASCTTNCVAPVTSVILDALGIQKAFVSTIHAYTSDQELVDGSHKDLRRARAAAINIVPTSTGAAIATTEVLPQLKGLFDGVAFRVPVVCGSVAEFYFSTSKRTSVQEVNKAFAEASQSRLRGILAVSEEPLVSTDIVGDSHSAIVDLSLTQVIDGDLVKVVAWYDNEWGYCCRLAEAAIMVGKKKHE